MNRGPLVPQTSALTRLRHAPYETLMVSLPGFDGRSGSNVERARTEFHPGLGPPRWGTWLVVLILIAIIAGFVVAIGLGISGLG